MKLIIVLLVCFCSLSGCTLTGTIIGDICDDNAPDFDTLMTNELIGFDPEDDILVVKKDGSTERGEFTSIEKVPAAGFGDTPLVSSMMMTTDSTRTQIPMESVRHVIVPNRKHGLITGLLVGAAIDAIVVVAVAATLEDFRISDH